MIALKKKTNKQLVQKYIKDVLTGKRIAGKKEIAAVKRHVNDLKHARKRGFRFDENLANQACDFFPLLKHTDGEWAGQPFELKPFQRFIVWCLFGWVRISDGMRRFRQALIELARGQGKSPFAAAILVLVWAFDCPIEQRAQGFTAATKKDQAKIVFEQAKLYVEQSPELRRLIKVFKTNLSVPFTNSTLRMLGQDSKNVDGLIPHVVVLDELHAWQERHRDLWGKITTAMGKRRQPLMLVITTAGDDESEIWSEIYDLCAQIVDPESPVVADDWFVFICEIDDDDDPFDERNWHKANPMLVEGVVKIDHLRNLAALARVDPVRKHELLRYHLNKKVTADTKLFPKEIWASGAGELPKLDGLTCHGGFDWGWKDDLAALALVFPLEAVAVGGNDTESPEFKRTYATKVQAWIPEDTPRDLTAEPWATWIANGWLRVTRGNSTDTAAIYSYVREVSQLYGIKTIAMDPNNAREFGSRVQPEFGIEPFWFGQNHGKYNEPTRELIAALNEGRFNHGNNPLLAWCANNVLGSVDSREYVKPEKKRSKDKIDPMCALIMGLSECLFAEREEKATGRVWAI